MKGLTELAQGPTDSPIEEHLGILQIPGPEIQPSEKPSDEKSSAEAQSLAAGTLEQDAAKNRHKRDEDFRNHASRARKTIFWFLIVSFMLMTAALVFHWITPWCFLDQKQLDTIKTIIGAALASKVFTDQAKHMS